MLTLPQAELDRITAYFAPPEFERVNVTQLDVAREKSRRRRLWRVARAQPPHAQAAGLCVGDDLAEADRRRAGRCDGRADGRGRRSRRALFVRRAARDARAEPGSAACEDLRPAHGLRRAGRGRARRRQCRADHRHDHAARASISARWPMRARSRSRRRFRSKFADAGAAARDRRSQDQDFGLHQCLRPPPCRPHRHPGRREEGHRALPDHASAATAPRTPRSATSSGTASWPRTCPTPSRSWSISISRSARAPTSRSSRPIAGSAKRRSRRRCMAAD